MKNILLPVFTLVSLAFASACTDTAELPDANHATYFAAPRADGSFDHNCSGTEKKEYLEAGGCLMTADYNCEVVPGWENDDIPECGKPAQWVTKCKKVYLGNGYSCKVDGTMSRVQRCH